MKIFGADTKASRAHSRSRDQSFTGGRARMPQSKISSASVWIAPAARGALRILDRHLGPFELASMDFVTHMPKSYRGKTFLLLFQDSFSGFVICKPMSSTTAQSGAEAYEECGFRRVGASSMLRHDQDPRFMSVVFSLFRALLGSKLRVTLAYRPQTKGQQERSVQTEIHDDFRVKFKVEDSGYRVNRWVHVSRLKPRALFPKRPEEAIEIAENDAFDAALLPEDSWEPDEEIGEYGVERILDN
ncbi:unnamed protein product [Phytophthora fragariaefolia]|uniref:Unnamed protein product n=1 Tax=Phytophthora fragariaefolia TaxID=1490495 RepID=A0A9W6TX31_9STRA|nr:unnamed protein product [Phytophthora fragariaefolia]